MAIRTRYLLLIKAIPDLRKAVLRVGSDKTSNLVTSLKQTEIRQIINERCLVASWPKMPISVEELAHLTKAVVERSDMLINKLGV